MIALPGLAGPFIPGLPHDARGFIPTDADARVAGCADVYAAGDATTFPLRQGGLAAQQADAAAEAIAARLGAIARAEPFRPVLRGVLLTGGAPLYLRAVVGDGGDPGRAARRDEPVEQRRPAGAVVASGQGRRPLPGAAARDGPPAGAADLADERPRAAPTPRTAARTTRWPSRSRSPTRTPAAATTARRSTRSTRRGR